MPRCNMLPDRVRLRHMLEAAQLALQFAAGVDREEFDRNIGMQFQVIRALEIIGEAASTLSPAFQQDHPAVPWSLMKRMRNRLIHAYFAVDLDIIWDTLRTNLPPMIPELQRILQEMPEDCEDQR